jgi:subtilase family serine protease
MPRAWFTSRTAACAAVCAAGLHVAIAGASPAANSRATPTMATTALAGSVAPLAVDNPGVAAVSGTERETIEVWMAGEQQAAQRFVDAVDTPGSPAYRRFLSPSAYTQRFGPSAADVDAVRSYLTGAGFSQVHPSVNDDYVAATAPVSTINRAFSVQMRRYRVAGADGKQTTIDSNDRALTVPASVSSDVLAVTGLNTAEPQTDETEESGATSRSRRAGAKAAGCSRYWAQKTTTFAPAFRGLTRAAIPPCGYSAKQLRAAYGLTSADTGQGKTIALIQIGGPDAMFQTLTDYARTNGLRAPRRSQYHEEAIGQGHRNPRCVNVGSTEAPLDSEAAYAVAPGANQLMIDGDDCVTSGGNYSQSLFNAELAPLTGNGSQASTAVESVSYVFSRSERTTVASQLKLVHAIALRAAAEGVSLLSSSGDHQGVSSASDPDITIVGGTTLGIGAHDQRLFETGWSTAIGERTSHGGTWQADGIHSAGGGGVSAVYGEPSYQQGVVPNSMALNRARKPGRTVPDISADGDPDSGAMFGYIVTHPGGRTSPFTRFTNAGTSMATPLVAGIVADAEQGQPTDLGFLNPLLYSLAGSPAYHDILPLRSTDPQVDRALFARGVVDIDHTFAQGFVVSISDAQDRRGTRQVTAPGYDTMTGLGTPNGPAFIKALRSGTRHPTPARAG